MEGRMVLVVILVAICCSKGLSSKTCNQNEYISKNGTCIICSTKCPDGQIITRECQVDEDIRCGCPSDKYFYDLTQTCLHCTLARPGQIYLKNCTSNSDADVENCPKDTFSFKSLKCSNCSICKHGESLVRGCTSSSDTVCEKKGQDGGSDDALGIALGISIPLVLLLLLVLFIWCRRRRQTLINNNVDLENNAMGSCNQRVYPLADDQEDDDKLHPMRKGKNPKRIGYQRASSQVSQSSITSGHIDPLADGGSICVIKSTSTQTVEWTKIEMSHLSWGCRNQLAQLLTPPSQKDWQAVADRLGFSNGDIRLLNTKDGIECAREMLNTYDTFEGASIPKLYEALKEIGRHDACSVLENFNKELQSSSKYMAATST